MDSQPSYLSLLQFGFRTFAIFARPFRFWKVKSVPIEHDSLINTYDVNDKDSYKRMFYHNNDISVILQDEWFRQPAHLRRLLKNGISLD